MMVGMPQLTSPIDLSMMFANAIVEPQPCHILSLSLARMTRSPSFRSVSSGTSLLISKAAQ